MAFLRIVLALWLAQVTVATTWPEEEYEKCNESLILRYCNFQDGHTTLNCQSANGFPEFRCAYTSNAAINVTTLRFEMTRVKVKDILTFVALPNLQALEFDQLTGTLSLAEILVYMSGIKRLRVTNTSVLPLIDSMGTTLSLFPGVNVSNDAVRRMILKINELEDINVEFRTEAESKSGYFKEQPVKKLQLKVSALNNFELDWLELNVTSLKTMHIWVNERFWFENYNPFTELTELTMYGNGGKFPERVLNYNQTKVLPKLRKLSLNRFAAVRLFDIIESNLTELELSSITGEVTHLFKDGPESLESVKIQDSRLSFLRSVDLGFLPNLKHLSIINAQMRYAAGDILTKLPQLQVFNLANNDLIEYSIDVEEAEKQRVQLKILNFSENKIRAFSLNALTFPKLEILDLSNNDISELLDLKFGSGKISRTVRQLNLSQNKLQCDCKFFDLFYYMPKDAVISGLCATNASSPIEGLVTEQCKAIPVSRMARATFDEIVLTKLENMTIDNENDEQLWSYFHDLRVRETTPSGGNQVRPNVGVGFSYEGEIVTGVENFMVHINIVWPSFALPSFQWNLTAFQTLCKDKDSLIAEICGDFIPLVQEAMIKVDYYSDKLEWKLGQIRHLFGFDTLEDMINSRKKRNVFQEASLARNNESSGLLQAKKETFNLTIDDSGWGKEDKLSIGLSVIFPGAGSAYSASVRAKRDKIFKSALESLVNRQDLLKGSFLELRHDLVLAINIIADTFQNTSKNIAKVHQLLNETNQELIVTFAAVEQSVNVLQQKIQAIRVLSVLTTRYMQLWSRQVNQYQLLNHEADKLFDAVALLIQGKISPYLVPPEQVRRLMKRAAETLNSWHNDYQLVFTDLAHVYEYSNVIFLPTAKGFVLQLLWPIRAKDAKIYDLFRVSSVHVPVTTTPSFSKVEANHDFSKVNIAKSYLGVATNNFVELSTEELNTCLKVDSLHLCFDTVLELDNSKLTCNTAVFLEAGIDAIIDLCDVDYYFEPYLPVPTTIDVGDKLLVSGLTLPWTRRCSNDRIPKKTEGSMYAVLNKTSLCHCSISAPNGFIPRRITGCSKSGKSEQPGIGITYTLNSLVTESFREEFNYSDVSFMHQQVMSDFVLPKLNVSKRVAASRLLDAGHGSVKLRELSRLIKEKEDEFLLKWDEVAGNIQFTSWFTRRNWPKGVTVAGAACGFLSLCLSLFLFCRGYYQHGFLQSLMFASMGRAARAQTARAPDTNDVEDSIIADLSSESLMKMTTVHVTVVIVLMLIMFAGKKCVQFCFREARVLMAHPELRKHPRVELFLELHSGTQRMLLYIMTVKAQIAKLKFEGQLNASHFVVDHHRFYSIIRLQWESAMCSLTVGHLSLELPSMIHVPALKKKKLQAMLKTSFESCIIATDGLYLYRLHENSREILTDQQTNPYTNLIRELRQREREFRANYGIDPYTLPTADCSMTTATAPPDNDASSTSASTIIDIPVRKN